MSTNPYESPGSIPVHPKGGSVGGKLRIAVTGAMGLLCILVLLALLSPVRRYAPEAGRKAQCMNNIKYIAMAVKAYEERYDAYPPAYTVDAAGNRLHSWRTLILPFLDRNDLYKKVDLAKPWNDPTNREVYETELEILQCPKGRVPAGHTTYMAVVSPDGVFQGATGRASKEILDDYGATLLIVEADSKEHRHWMSPQDVDLSWLHQFGDSDELPHQGVHMATVDGRVLHLRPGASVGKLSAMISIAGGDDDVARGDE